MSSRNRIGSENSFTGSSNSSSSYWSKGPDNKIDKANSKVFQNGTESEVQVKVLNGYIGGKSYFEFSLKEEEGKKQKNGINEDELIEDFESGEINEAGSEHHEREGG